MNSENHHRKTVFNVPHLETNENKRTTHYQNKLVLGEVKRFFIEKDVINGCQRVNILNELSGKMLKVDYDIFMTDLRRAINLRNEEMLKKKVDLCFVEHVKYSDWPCVVVKNLDMSVPDTREIIRVIEPPELHRFIYRQHEITGMLFDLFV